VRLSSLSPGSLYAKRHLILPRLEALCLRKVHSAGFAVTEDDRWIRSLKDKHRGKRAFILGNGPSLQVADLDRLKGEITFASNKIYLAFGQTEWRPTYYFVFDRLVAKNNAEIIRDLPLVKILSDDLRQFFPGKTDIHWLRETFPNWVWLDQAEGKPTPGEGVFSTDLLVEIAGGWTVVYSQLQAAYYMGVTEVILMGVDFSFDVPAAKVATNESGYEVALKSAGERNHFHPDYRKPGEIWAVPRLDMQLRAFELARRVFESDKRTVVNASRRTKLEVFPVRNAEEFLPAV